MADKPPRVLIFAMAFLPEAVGSGTYAFRLARGFAERGCRVRVLAPQDAGGRWQGFDAGQPFETVRFAAPRQVLAQYLTARRWLRRSLAEFAPDTLWTTNGMATRVAGWTPELDYRALSLVSCMRGSDITTRLPGRGLWARLESIVQRRCYARSEAIAAASEYLKRVAVAKGVDGERIFVNPSAFDFTLLDGYTYNAARVTAAYPRLADRQLVLCVARLSRQKRVHVVLEALAMLAERVPRALLVLAGDGPQRAALERRAQALGIAERVVFAGPQAPLSTPLFDLYSRAQVFVMAGVREGMPNVFMEAGAFGAPSVGVDDGGVPEVIQDGRTGLLAAPDDASDLAAKLERLLGDCELARRLGAQAREWIHQAFSGAALEERSFRVLTDVLSKAESASGDAADHQRPGPGAPPGIVVRPDV
jgi:glycosyltransferase involved in cell wall biosynthesis